MVFDPRLTKLIEILRFAYRTLRRMGIAQTRDLIQPPFLNDSRLQQALPDLLTYFNIAERRAGKLHFKLRGLSGEKLREYERRIDRLVVLKLKLFQIYFWKAVSRSADEFDPHEKLADIRAFLKSYGLSEDIAHTYINLMIIVGRAETAIGGGGGIRIKRNTMLPDGRQPARGELVVLHSNSEGEKEGVRMANKELERELYPDLKVFFETPLRGNRTEHFEYAGWTVSLVSDKNDGSPGKGNKRFDGTEDMPDLGDMRNADLVGYRIETNNPMGIPDIEVLCVEVKKEFSRESIAQATAYLEFANIVYVAVPEKAEELRRHKLLINACNKNGIGLVSMEKGKWQEAIPPRYQVQRRRANAFILQKYFPSALTRIKNEFYGEMGPFKLQVPG